MFAKLASHGVNLQDLIGRLKHYASTLHTDELSDAKLRENKAMKPEAAREQNRDLDNIVTNIRKADTLVPALDAFCGALPQIVKEISTHEADNPPLSFV